MQIYKLEKTVQTFSTLLPQRTCQWSMQCGGGFDKIRYLQFQSFAAGDHLWGKKQQLSLGEYSSSNLLGHVCEPYTDRLALKLTSHNHVAQFPNSGLHCYRYGSYGKKDRAWTSSTSQLVTHVPSMRSWDAFKSGCCAHKNSPQTGRHCHNCGFIRR